jgi:hypothetical protein
MIPGVGCFPDRAAPCRHRRVVRSAQSAQISAVTHLQRPSLGFRQSRAVRPHKRSLCSPPGTMPQQRCPLQPRVLWLLGPSDHFSVLAYVVEVRPSRMEWTLSPRRRRIPLPRLPRRGANPPLGSYAVTTRPSGPARGYERLCDGVAGAGEVLKAR